MTICSGLANQEALESVPECAIYDVASDTWRMDGELGTPINHAAYCVAGDDIVIISGQTGRNAPNEAAFTTCQRFNMVTRETTSCTDMPAPTRGTGACINAAGATRSCFAWVPLFLPTRGTGACVDAARATRSCLAWVPVSLPSARIVPSSSSTRLECAREAAFAIAGV